jgi:hypothetical protein
MADVSDEVEEGKEQTDPSRTEVVRWWTSCSCLVFYMIT